MESNVRIYDKLEPLFDKVGYLVPFSLAFSVLTAAAISLAHRHMVPTSEKICQKLNRQFLGTQSALLSLCLSFFPIYDVRFDTCREKNFTNKILDYSILLNLTVLVPAAIILREGRERAEKESMYYSIFSFLGGTIAHICLNVCRATRLGSFGMLLLYGVHLEAFLSMGKSYIANFSICPEPRPSNRRTFALDVVAGVCPSEGKASFAVFLVSSFVSGLSFHATYFTPAASSALCILGVSFLLSCGLYAGTKKTGLLRLFYTLLCCTAWLKIISTHLGSMLLFLSDRKNLLNQDFVRISVYGWKNVFPTLCVVLCAVFQKSYKMAVLLPLLSSIQHILVGKSMFFIAGNGYPLDGAECSLETLCFFMSIIAVIVLFVNNELRSSMLERELGVTMLLLYFVFLLLCQACLYLDE